MKLVAPIFCLLLLSSLATAQLNPPTAFNVSHDGRENVSLSWNEPGVNEISGPRDLVDWPETFEERLNWNPDWDAVRQEWEELQNTRDELDDLVFYIVYRNGEQWEFVWDTEYEDVLPQPGTYTYAVSAFYDEGESALTSESVVNWYDHVTVPIDEDFDDGMPDGWIVESTGTSSTWHVGAAPGSWGNDFPTPVCFVDSDAVGSQYHCQERLLMPNFDFSETSYVELTFDFFLREDVNEHLYVEYRIDGGQWVTVADYSTPGAFFDEMIDLTNQLAGEQDVDISFYYDDFDNWGYYCGIDDVMLLRELVNPDPIEFDLIGMERNIPATGGVVGYDLSLVSQVPNTIQNVHYWATVTPPGGGASVQVGYRLFTHTPFMNVSYRFLQLAVPAEAQPGDYTFTGNLGLTMGVPMVSDSFTFTKHSAAAGTSTTIDPSKWISYGLEAFDQNVNRAETPSTFELGAAWPNPFNPATSFSVSLPQASDLRVAVYNTLGQQVAELTNDRMAAGEHTFTFDASSLASGLYFVRATAGDWTDVQKVMLVR